MSVLQYPGRPGPDNSRAQHINYTVNSCFPSRRPRPSSLRGHGSIKRDIKDTMQHATLINIVAAVNEDVHCRSVPRKGSGSTSNSLQSTVTVISNFMIPREKSVSIPQSKQRIFDMPDEMVQRKPVYYKHSGDLEVRIQPHLRLFDERNSYNLKMKNPETVQKPKPLAREIIQSLPRKPQIMNINLTGSNKVKSSEEKESSTQKEYEPRVASGVRQLGAVKKIERRQLRDLPKCDAVDFLDTQVENDLDTSQYDDSSKVIPPYTPTRIPYIRTKSLPVIFPTKTGNRASLTSQSLQRQPTIFRDRPLSQSLRNQTPESLYRRINNLPSGFGFGELTINNGFNQAPDISGRLVHDSDKQPTLKVSTTGTTNKSVTMDLRSPPCPNVFITARNDFHVYQTRSYKMKTNNSSKCDLHDAVRNAMNGRTARTESGVSKSESRPITSARSKKSCLTSRSGFSDNFVEVRTPKRVQFLGSESSMTSSEPDSDREESTGSTAGRSGSGVLRTQTPIQLRAYSPGIQPMSVRELLRLEQKILPANTPPPPPDILANYYTTNSLINVHALHRSNSDMSSKLNTVSGDPDSNLDDSNKNGDFTASNGEVHDDGKARRYVNKTSEESDTTLGSNDQTDESEEGDDNDEGDEIGFYKLVKAVDRQPYDGFEHKKIRRSSVSSKPSDQEKGQHKAQYVKVRIS